MIKDTDMKWVIVLLFIFFASSAAAQIILTQADVALQFIADPTGQWRPVEGFSVDYSMDPVVVHNSKGRLGLQSWEGLLQADEPGLGKFVVTFVLDSLPSPTFRAHIIRVRVRDGVGVADWVVSDSIRILGNPGKPVHK